jgi:putative ABC transport system permease protein
MSCSIALSIILFLLFQSLLNPDVMGVRPIQDYTADLRISSEDGITTDLYHKLQAMGSVKRINGRMSTYVAASVRADNLTAFYKSKLKEKPMADKDGFLKNPEKSWLISYDDTQLKWAKSYLTMGTADEDYLTKKHGVILVNKVYRDGILIKTTSLNIGDKVKLPTGNGTEEFTILGIADSIPYSTDETTMTTFITTEELFKEISDDTAYKTIDIQLNNSNPEGTVEQIKKLAGGSLKVGDRRQMNHRNNNVYLTFCVFIYGFVGVITLISILNIVNTMNSSVSAKMKRFGVMRAVGLSGSQLSKMVFAEAATFCLTGCLFGCIIGVALRKEFTAFLLVHWSFPVIPVILIVVTCLFASLLSVLRPLQQIKRQGISDTINAL